MTRFASRDREASPSESAKRFAVVGHVEWIEFGRFSHVPEPGEIIEATEWFSEAAGSAAVVAVQLAKLSGDVDFFTALGDDWRGRAAAERLGELGVRVHAAKRESMQRWGFVHLDDDGERTISILGERHVPLGADDLPWERIEGAAAVFVSGGDHAAMREARRGEQLVATPRALSELRGVQLDALVGSGKDRLEQVDPDTLDPRPHLIITTAGKEGGTWTGREGHGRFEVAELPGPMVDEYGAGDTFAAGFTYGLGAGWDVDRALKLAARAGAANLTGRGPYAGQLTSPT
jgi:ribokinase